MVYKYENQTKTNALRDESIRRYVARMRDRYFFKLQASAIYDAVALMHFVSPSTVHKAIAVEGNANLEVLVLEELITFYVGF